MAPAHPSHHVFQPPDFVLYLGPGPGEVLENQSVRSTHHIPEILTKTPLMFVLRLRKEGVDRCCCSVEEGDCEENLNFLAWMSELGLVDSLEYIGELNQLLFTE